MPESATYIIIAIVLVSIFLMWDTSRSTRCRWCEHCQAIEAKEKRQREILRHVNYHTLTGGSAEKCTDPRCKGL